MRAHLRATCDKGARRRGAWLAPAGLLALVATLLAPGAATAARGGPAPAPARITVSGGYGGFYVPARHVPVSVAVTSDRLVRGTLEVTVRPQDGPSESASRVRVPVEIPGGSRKSFLVVAPPVQSFGPTGAVVSARLLDGQDREVLTSDRQPLQADANQELVGLLPGSLATTDPPAAAPLAVDVGGVARFVKLGRAELAQAPASLESLGTIAAGGDDLVALAPATRQALLRWLGDGGNLLVDAPLGSRVEGLPEAWQPGAEGYGAAGMGRVRLTAGAMAAGRWDRLVEPTVSGTGSEGWLGFGGPVGSIGDALAVDAGLRVPALGWLLTFLLAYVVVVGPVTAVVLGRRRRSELAWLVIPLVAVVFSGGSYLGARQLRGGTKLAHGTALEFDAAGAKATSFVGVAARGRHTSEVSFPQAWSATANPQTLLSRFTGRPHASSVDVTPRGPTARLALGAGQFGIASGVRPHAGAGDLEVTAQSSEDGQAGGKVRNRMPYALEDVAVFVGSSGVAVGRLEPGAEREWAVGDRRGAHDPSQPAEYEIWSQSSGQFGRVDPDSVVNFPLWQVTAGQMTGQRPTGVAVAVGWTRAHRPTVLVDGTRKQPVGRTAVLARTAVAAPGKVTDLSVRGQAVRSPGGRDAFGADGRDLSGAPRMVLRWTLPAGRQPANLVATLPDAGPASEVWLDGRWQALTRLGEPDAPPGGDGASAPQGGARIIRPGGARVIVPPPVPFGGGEPFAMQAGPFGPMVDYELPVAAARDGLVFVRAPFSGDVGSMAMTLHERQP